MRDILIDPQLRGRMERLGLQRAAAFNWQKTARQTLDVYREVTESGAVGAGYAEHDRQLTVRRPV
jgi:glycosyltransferase involved in cell wall biosynthesis